MIFHIFFSTTCSTTFFTFSKEKKLEWFENLNVRKNVDQKWVEYIFFSSTLTLIINNNALTKGLPLSEDLRMVCKS